MLTRIANRWLFSLSLLVLVGCVNYAAADEPSPGLESAKENAQDTIVAAEEARGEEPHVAGHDSKVEKYDNSHSNATADLEKPEQMNRYDLSIYTFVVFALLMALLWKFAWGPIASGLDMREASIAKMIDDAKLASESAARQLQQYEQKLLAAQEEAGRLIGDARKQGEEVAAKIRAEAEAVAEKQRQQAVSDIQQAKNLALREIAQKSVSTAVELAGKIIHREVREADHQQLIRESLERFSKN
ncbi:MAG TPA: F0F1 ATP synthase subunit B [Pirellulaceae bacterium]|nr:F0F1 ATP synthase subunit B [Pirellulaceae bacterium]